jgi:hypothetical protein
MLEYCRDGSSMYFRNCRNEICSNVVPRSLHVLVGEIMNHNGSLDKFYGRSRGTKNVKTGP